MGLSQWTGADRKPQRPLMMADTEKLEQEQVDKEEEGGPLPVPSSEVEQPVKGLEQRNSEGAGR